MRRFHKKIAFILSLTLSITGAAPSFADQSQKEIVLRTEEEFLAFAKNCYTQVYSDGQIFSLQNDLDLTGMELTPIPLFCGTFEGNGHEIRGMVLEHSGSDLGLFRYIEDGASVRNLHVSGSVITDDSSEQVGGIAGVNRGEITGCSFTGTVVGNSSVGGIVGHNEESGVIFNCQNKTSVTGTRMAGGIAGYQEGQISGCINLGNINTDPDHLAESGESQESLSLDRDQLRINFSEEKVQDIGGIAGRSEGIITDCKNSGAVGSERMGDYVGGIAGRQNGQIQSCENEGVIIGRRYIGGIVGQLEPYLHFLYEEDTIDQLEAQMDELSGIKDDFSSTLDRTSDQSFDHFDEVKRITKEIRSITSEHKDEQKEKRDEFRKESDEHLDEIQNVLADLELDIGSRDARSAMSRISKNIRTCKDLLKSLGGNLKPDLGTPSDSEELQMYDKLGADFWIGTDDISAETAGELLYAYEITKQLASCAGSIMEDVDIIIFKGSSDVEDDIQDFVDDLDSLRNETNDFVTLTRDYLDQLMDDLDVLDDDLSTRLDELETEGDTLFDILKDGKDSMKAEKNRLNNLLDRIDQVLKDGKERIRDHADQILDDDDLLDDISDDTWQELSDGMVLNCQNQGMIMGESESGGITGNIGIKVLEDLKDQIAADGDRSLNILKQAKAVIIDCKNEGNVQVRYHLGGGITGNMTLGLIRACENFGDITSENGDYAGGIAGKSSGIIRNSYSMSTVTGENYIGGIAGWAKELHENAAMTALHTDAYDRFGMIAGWADPDDGVLSGNLYVDEGIGAVNGITYTAQASGLSYDEFLKIPELPYYFYQMKVTFLCDGKRIDSIRCSYGDSLDGTQFPTLPQKAGYYAKWECDRIDRVANNMQIHAVYEPYTTVIASDEEPMAFMLAEGNFYPGTVLSAEKTEKGASYNIRQEDGTLYPGNVILRIFAEDSKHANVELQHKDGTVTAAESRRDGKYLVFEAPSEAVVLIHKNMPIAEIAVVSVILLAVGMWIWRRKYKKQETSGLSN